MTENDKKETGDKIVVDNYFTGKSLKLEILPLINHDPGKTNLYNLNYPCAQSENFGKDNLQSSMSL